MINVDDVIKLLNSLQIPGFIIVAIIVFCFCVKYANNVLILNGCINGFLGRFFKGARKKQIANTIRGNVRKASQKIGQDSASILPSDLKIKWADNDDIKSFLDDDCVIIRLRKDPNPNINYVNIIFSFISSGLLTSQRKYFDPDVLQASDLIMTRKILAESKPSACDYFYENILFATLDKFPEVKDLFNDLDKIDGNGMLINVYLKELVKAGERMENQLPDPCLISESKELLRYLYKIALKLPGQSEDLDFSSTYFKIGVVLTASNHALLQSGLNSHRRAITKLIDDGYETIYIFGIGKKVDWAKKLAKQAKADNEEICCSITHTYRHRNSYVPDAKEVRRLPGICIELTTS